MENCIFCKIVNGEISCVKIWEDKNTFAFLDVNPINPGHLLVIPKKHSRTFYEEDEKDFISVMKTVKKMAEKINKNLKPKKVGLLIVGWDVDHTHVHVVPMNDYYDLTSKRYLEGKKQSLNVTELNKIAQKIRGKR